MTIPEIGWKEWQKKIALEKYANQESIPDIAKAVRKKSRTVLSFFLHRGFKASILFSEADDLRLARLYPSCSWRTVVGAFPGREKRQIIFRANQLEIYRVVGPISRGQTDTKEEYGMTETEWRGKAKTPPKDHSTTIHPALKALFTGGHL